MENNIAKYKDQLIFALDIGTRSVVGILGTMVDEVYTVLDYVQKFHPIRAMRDGQVEDIELVSKVCREVKEELEGRHGIELKTVAIAAAGRALMTCRAHEEMTLAEDDAITVEMMRSLEFSAISRAQENFIKENENADVRDFQCVGYSVLDYRIDGYQIRNLEGHKGSTAEVDIIAAFLPFSVVKSLYAVTSRCGLEVTNLTLEPIAAINVIVPADVRLLNIAIADIGAGTSDIAISKNGSIVAYDMATIAGDEVTESIMSAYLTDFDTAESIKKSLDIASDRDIDFEDILGFTYTYKSSEIIEKISPTIDKLASAIADSIMANNDGAPVAVFLIGGGSQVPGLCKNLAGKLGMPENRVALGGTRQQKHINTGFDELMTPEFVTPIGIGTLASQYRGADFFAITVNGQRIMLMHSGTIRVLDALLLAGIKATSLMGRSSRGIRYYLNGEVRNVRGKLATPGRVELNGVEVSLEADVKQGDSLIVIAAENGADPELLLSDIEEVRNIEGWNCIVKVNGKRMPTFKKYIVANGDQIEIVAVSDEEMEAYNQEDEALKASDPDAYEGAQSDDDQTYEGEISDEYSDLIDSDDIEEYDESSEASAQPAPVEQETYQRPTIETIPDSAAPAAAVEEAVVESAEAVEAAEIEAVEAAEPEMPAVSETAEIDVQEAAAAEVADTPETTEIETEELEITGNSKTDTASTEEAHAEESATEAPKVPAADGDSLIIKINGANCRVALNDSKVLRFMDLIEYTGVEKEEPGERLILTINGRSAAYVDEVKAGDDVVIRWDR